MKIRTKLTLLFILITAGILLVFAGLIYFSAQKNREKEFYALLRKEAITKANLFLDGKVDAPTLQRIYRNNRMVLNEVEVAIYDTGLNLLYHDAVDIDFVKETPAMLQQIQEKGEIKFYQDGWQVIGIKYEFEGKFYLLTAAAFDEYGYTKLRKLLSTAILVFVCSMAFIYLCGVYFSKKALQPVTEMTSKVRKISATSLDLRLNVLRNGDELAELAKTFNGMLERLEKSFDAQKSFVSNISHELRTPLAAVTAELELALRDEKTTEEYKTALKNALGDARKLARLSDSLLDLAKTDYDATEISFKPARTDEILLDARSDVIKRNPEYQISIEFDNVEGGESLMIRANEYLLKTAFANLMENGCKFSKDKSCLVTIGAEITGPGKEKANPPLTLRFSDKGIGIPEDDMPFIFTPFYRGANTHFTHGNGIGLSLTQKIIHLHGGKITVKSAEGEGSVFSVTLFPAKSL